MLGELGDLGAHSLRVRVYWTGGGGGRSRFLEGDVKAVGKLTFV